MQWRFLYRKISRPYSLYFCLYKIVCIDDKFTKPTILYRGENAAYEFIKAILEEILQKILHNF